MNPDFGDNAPLLITLFDGILVSSFKTFHYAVKRLQFAQTKEKGTLFCFSMDYGKA